MARAKITPLLPTIFSFYFSSVGPTRLGSRFFLSSSGTVLERATRDGELRVYMIAGEVSGDNIASRLMSALRLLSPLPVRFAGVGGASMRAKGLRSLFPMEDIAVMGIWELLPHLRTIRKKIKEAIQDAFQFQPHVVVTVDAKGFSFRFLRQLRDKCTKEGRSAVHVHYIAPSFWAWKGGETRLSQICRIVDHMLCILPFEVEVCRENGLDTTFVGHPSLEDAFDLNLGLSPHSDNIMIRGSAKKFRCKYGLDMESTIITLLPGSRMQEVIRMLPIFMNTVELLKNSFPGLTVVIPVAPHQHIKEYIDKSFRNGSIPFVLIPGDSLVDKYGAYSASKAALCTSGTAVIELQLSRLPCVVSYRAHFLTEWIIKLRAKLLFISLPNILLDTSAIPEALFEESTPNNLAKLLKEVICNDKVRETQIASAEKVLRLLRLPVNTDGMALHSDESNYCLANRQPSVVAASTILHVAKKQ